MVGRWTCNPEVPGSNLPPCHWMDLSSVAPNSTPPRCVNSQLVSLPPVGIYNLLCLICITFCLLRAFEHIHMKFARYKCFIIIINYYLKSVPQSSFEFFTSIHLLVFGCSFFVGQRLSGWVVSKRLGNKSAWSSSCSPGLIESLLHIVSDVMNFRVF